MPESMTWEELERLSEDVAGEIELWDGRVVWVRREPAEHQNYTGLMWSGLRRAAREARSTQPERCWEVAQETNVFFGQTGKSDFMTPGFLVCRCRAAEFDDVRTRDVALVGEVLSPSNTPADLEARKARFARAGIPWYWEVAVVRGPARVEVVRAYALETRHGELAEGVRPLHPANYVLAGEWTPRDPGGIDFDFPFPIHIPWAELEV